MQSTHQPFKTKTHTKGCIFLVNEAGSLIMHDGNEAFEIVSPEAVMKFADFVKREAEARIFEEKDEK